MKWGNIGDMVLEIKSNMKVMLALTYDCPCNCGHCGADMYKKNILPLTKNQITDILDQVSSLGVDFIYFFGGEPLLDNNIYEYISYAKSVKLRTMLDTNGVVLDKKMVLSLKQAGLDVIGISLDSPLEETHDARRGVKGLYKNTLLNAAYCQKIGITVYFSTVVTKQNLRNGEFVLMTRLAETMGIPLKVMSPIQCGKWSGRRENILSEEDKYLLRKRLKKDKVYWERQDQCNENCSFVCAFTEKMFMYISAYGAVQPCCFFPVSFGNIKEEKIAVILDRMWHSKLFSGQFNLKEDCPVNSQQIRDFYGLDELKEYPKMANV
jgi:MoaA/NifB/PqqE/SkfB family radical SAM enzyme